jgi:hypothetical protein
MRTRSILALGLGVPLLVVGGFALFVLNYDGRQDIELQRFVGDTAWMMPNARMATDELCDEGLPCVQAVESDTLTMLKFRTKEEAAAVAAAAPGDSHLSGWIVVRYRAAELSEGQREEFEGFLDCHYVGIGADGQEC